MQKWILCEKVDKEYLDCKKLTLKSQWSKSKTTTSVKVNSPQSTAQVNESMAMTSAAVWVMMWRMTQLGLMWQGDVVE